MQDLKTQFLIDTDITYLNFGAFGACPKTIFEDYVKWQRELEHNPVQYITVNGPKYLQQARAAIGNYVNCQADDVVYITNPTYAVNTVAKNLNLQQGDEILTTNLEYGACDRTWQYYCEKTGAKYIQQNISIPLVSTEFFLEEFFKGVTKNTKLIFISHITSATALILPMQQICDYANQKGILVFIDGAHAVGQVAIDLQKLNVDFYTAACHKWMMAPKGCSFFYAKKAHQQMLEPMIVSWGYNAVLPSSSQFLDYHQFIGTRDFSAYLTIPAVLKFMQQNNWDQVAANCKKIVLQNAEKFCKLLNAKSLCPITDTFVGQMFSIPINTNNAAGLKETLFNKYKIEIPVMPHNGKMYIRYSIQAFNSQHDLDLLYEALSEIIATDKELLYAF